MNAWTTVQEILHAAKLAPSRCPFSMNKNAYYDSWYDSLFVASSLTSRNRWSSAKKSHQKKSGDHTSPRACCVSAYLQIHLALQSHLDVPQECNAKRSAFVPAIGELEQTIRHEDSVFFLSARTGDYGQRWVSVVSLSLMYPFLHCQEQIFDGVCLRIFCSKASKSWNWLTSGAHSATCCRKDGEYVRSGESRTDCLCWFLRSEFQNVLGREIIDVPAFRMTKDITEIVKIDHSGAVADGADLETHRGTEFEQFLVTAHRGDQIDDPKAKFKSTSSYGILLSHKGIMNFVFIAQLCLGISRLDAYHTTHFLQRENPQIPTVESLHGDRDTHNAATDEDLDQWSRDKWQEELKTELSVVRRHHERNWNTMNADPRSGTWVFHVAFHKLGTTRLRILMVKTPKGHVDVTLWNS